MRKSRLKKSLAVLVLVCILGGLAELLFAVFGRELIPRRVTVHASQQMIRSVTLDGKDMTRSDRSSYSSPVFYGPHDLRIVLADGKVVWASFFDADTGVVRQIDIYVGYRPGNDMVTFRETNTRYRTWPGVTRTVFTGNTRPEGASQTKPFTLEWI